MEIKISKTVKHPSKEGHPTKIRNQKFKLTKQIMEYKKQRPRGAPNPMETKKIKPVKNPSQEGHPTKIGNYKFKLTKQILEYKKQA